MCVCVCVCVLPPMHVVMKTELAQQCLLSHLRFAHTKAAIPQFEQRHGNVRVQEHIAMATCRPAVLLLS